MRRAYYVCKHETFALIVPNLLSGNLNHPGTYDRSANGSGPWNSAIKEKPMCTDRPRSRNGTILTVFTYTVSSCSVRCHFSSRIHRSKVAASLISAQLLLLASPPLFPPPTPPQIPPRRPTCLYHRALASSIALSPEESPAKGNENPAGKSLYARARGL